MGWGGVRVYFEYTRISAVLSQTHVGVKISEFVNYLLFVVYAKTEEEEESSRASTARTGGWNELNVY